MRLDLWLVKNWFFQSRNQAQEAILRGDIYINWKQIKKFSYKVWDVDKIEFLWKNLPRWYYKLEYIDRNLNLFKNVNKVLDLWSSKWGFLYYALEKVDYVVWIEISKQFEKYLLDLKKIFTNKKYDIIFDDIFKIDINKLLSKHWKFDLILADLTLEPIISFQWIKRFFDVLRDNWKLLWVHKGRKNIFDWKLEFSKCWYNNFEILPSIDRDEFYIKIT